VDRGSETNCMHGCDPVWLGWRKPSKDDVTPGRVGKRQTGREKGMDERKGDENERKAGERDGLLTVQPECARAGVCVQQ